MSELCIPDGVRLAAPVILIGPDGRVLLFEGSHGEGRSWWVMPGGGLEEGEGFAEAAIRETLEETGIDVKISDCVWTRHHAYRFDTRQFNQYERFFVARTTRTEVRPVSQDNYVKGHRWWSLEEIASSTEEFAPRRLADFLPAILSGRLPREALDVD